MLEGDRGCIRKTEQQHLTLGGTLVVMVVAAEIGEDFFSGSDIYIEVCRMRNQCFMLGKNVLR